MRVEKNHTVYDYKVGVATVGYNSAKEIERVLTPFLGNIDIVICGDGKYEFYPGKTDYSEDGWLDLAEKLCKDKAEFIGYQYAGRQVDKRQKYLELAGKAKCDFLICIDTDDYVMPEYSDWAAFYYNLFVLSEILPDRVYHKWVWIPNNKTWPKNGNMFPSNSWRKSPRIHKDPGTMRYCMDSHFMWCHKDVSDDKLLKWQLKHRDQDNPYEFVCKNVVDGVRDTMDRALRTKEQMRAAKQWAFINHHAEESRKFYTIMRVRGNKPPQGFDSWDQFEKAPHTFDKKTGQRIEL